MSGHIWDLGPLMDTPDRVRQLEDAVLGLWMEFTVAQAAAIEQDSPRLVAFIHAIERDITAAEWMMRRNVWAEDGNPNDEP